jgi:NADPH-dependent glutamate synthase beta subunit-like oxidoreductase
VTDRPFAITLDVLSSLANHTGTWRDRRPVYLDGVPPCTHACPAGEPVQKWLYDAEEGNYEAAWRALVEVNPFPAIMGRVCYHPCEGACNRAELDQAVGINSIERFLGDLALERGWSLPPAAADTGKRVLVIGAGPAGLAAAYHLRRLGHAVEIREAGDQLGGMMRFGIPTFRLPRDVLDIEVARVIDLGISVRLSSPVTDLDAALRDDAFDAAYLAIGAQLSHRAYVPAVQAARILDALQVLGEVAEGARPQLGRTVLVYGGGNTAMDAARTARRLGADHAVVVYRRTRQQMPANDIEVCEAVDEGVEFRWLRTIESVSGDRVRLEKMELDESGRPQPTGEYEELSGDCVVLALGQDVDRAVLESLPGLRVVDGVAEVDAAMMTGHPGVFAGGDVVPSERSVTSAVGQGRRAAAHIDRWLHDREPVLDGDMSSPVSFDALNSWYFTDAPHAVRPRLEAARRVSDFDEVVGGLDADTALYEARRCLSCGNCFGCDNCYGVCPDNAVHKLTAPGADGRSYVIDYDYCKGCGLCVTECPSGAIVMVDETT